MNLARLLRPTPFFLFFLLLNTTNVRAQQGTNQAVQANIIYHFTKYIDWPGDRKSGDFIIGVVGDSPLYEELKNFTSTKTVGIQRIVVRKFTASTVALNCQILFISDDASGSLKKIVAGTMGVPILIVTETDGLARKGSCINFILVDDHLKLEINKNTIEQRNLGIASELLQLGILVK
jgi:hypothetical protein